MSTMQCNLCDRPVEAKKYIGAGTLILCILTGGLWIIAILFYRQRCSICKSDNLIEVGGEMRQDQEKKRKSQNKDLWSNN